MMCAPAPKQNHLANHWHQEVTKCPILTDPVDGGWSAWSAWSGCQHGSADHGRSHAHGHVHSHGHSHSEHAEVRYPRLTSCKRPGTSGCERRNTVQC